MTARVTRGARQADLRAAYGAPRPWLLLQRVAGRSPGWRNHRVRLPGRSSGIV